VDAAGELRFKPGVSAAAPFKATEVMICAWRTMLSHWFKVELQFVCPSCNRVSIENVIARAKNKTAGAIAIIERLTITCQLCKAICSDAVQIQMLMKDLTPEELANLQIDSSASSQRSR
jgi:Pyruvate/2-oxoacid:ferredoxin oxidoreductase delta subunit